MSGVKLPTFIDIELFSWFLNVIVFIDAENNNYYVISDIYLIVPPLKLVVRVTAAQWSVITVSLNQVSFS